MKKSILAFVMMLFIGGTVSAQVAFSINEPSPNSGGYEISISDGADWGSPDMLDPANVVEGTLCLAHDSLACEPLTNGADLVGKIVVVYRGDCEFGAKALAAQNEGAIAVVIVNHSPGVIPMGGGADGLTVTIPVVMISNADGATLYDEMASCSISGIIGNLNGFYADNLRLTNGTLLRPSSYGQIAQLNLDDTEFDVPLGTWVYNFGQSEETSAVVNVTVTYNDNPIYNEDSDDLFIPVGDSVYVTMPTFSDSSYPVGQYDVDYTVSGTNEDQFMADNLEVADFRMGGTFSYSRLNDDNAAWPTNYTSAAEPVGESNYCIYFSDPNASRVSVSGFDFSGTHFDEVITDFDIELVVYEWEDDYMGLETTLTSFNEVDSEGYTFGEGEEDVIISLPLSNSIPLDDDVHYLFCIRHSNEGLQMGYDNKTNYTENYFAYQTPISPSFDEGEGFVAGFGPDLVPAFSVRLDGGVGVAEQTEKVDITPYPNPASEQINIPFTDNLRGMALMNIFNTEGKIVSSQKINVSNAMLQVDITSLANGNYVFDLQFEDNLQSTFNVVINR